MKVLSLICSCILANLMLLSDSHDVMGGVVGYIQDKYCVMCLVCYNWGQSKNLTHVALTITLCCPFIHYSSQQCLPFDPAVAHWGLLIFYYHSDTHILSHIISLSRCKYDGCVYFSVILTNYNTSYTLSHLQTKMLPSLQDLKGHRCKKKKEEERKNSLHPRRPLIRQVFDIISLM